MAAIALKEKFGVDSTWFIAECPIRKSVENYVLGIREAQIAHYTFGSTRGVEASTLNSFGGEQTTADLSANVGRGLKAGLRCDAIGCRSLSRSVHSHRPIDDAPMRGKPTLL